MQNQPPNVSLVHVDWEYAVVNIHLSTAFNDTGTAFYKSKRGPAVCMEETALHNCLRDFEEQDAYHRRWGGHGKDHCGLCLDRHLACEKWAQSGNCVDDPGSMHRLCPHSCGTCAGLWPGPALPRGEDHAGLFELVHVEPFRMNRLMVYNGHIWHSSFYPLSSLNRLLVQSPMAGRLMLQHGLKVPALQAAFSTWKEIMDAAEEAKKPNFLLGLMGFGFGLDPCRCFNNQQRALGPWGILE
ncbi:unnamed protein product [Symbiodinium sp. CCMP2456]|nr:unnamed protein product [Symbiodinium sp. CCMP2456]